MKAIVIKPGKYACIKNLDLSYHNLRTLVGGYIEMTYPFPDEEIAVISNEEAKLLDLAPNRAIRSSEGEVIDIYCGTMVVFALAPEGEYRSLTEEEVNALNIEEEVQVKLSFAEGDTVDIIDGLFEGYSGTVQTVSEDMKTATVLVRRGRRDMPVELECNMLRLAAKNS